ncbi:MAG: mechanosensitive ion channel [Anaerolineales bacterium]|nr:mechanosensitive ion channel [Anaerolineales bacterium]
MQAIQEFLQEYLSLTPDVQSKLFSTLLVIFVLWVLRLLALRIVHRRFEATPQTLYNSRKIVDYVLVVIGIFVIGRIWIDAVQSLATYLGLLSAGLAIALQDLIVSLAGWIFIMWRRPFDVGDRIQIGTHKGDVIDVRLFAFSLLEIGNRINAEQSTGRIIHLPNGSVFKESFANYTQGLPYIWNEIPVMVTFESDWEKAKALLTDIVTRHAPDVSEGVNKYNKTVNKRFVITYNNVTPIVYTEVADSGVILTMRYMLNPRSQRSSTQAIWEDVLHAFKAHWDIDFAYPTQREYINYQEKKQPPIHEAPTVVMQRPTLVHDEKPRDPNNPGER